MTDVLKTHIKSPSICRRMIGRKQKQRQVPETTHYLKHTTIHVNVTRGNEMHGHAWLPVAESVLVTCTSIHVILSVQFLR